MSNGTFSNLVHYSAPLRRFGGSVLARYLVLATGLIAMTAFTVPELRTGDAGVWLAVCLWCCLAYFAIEGAGGLRDAMRAERPTRHILSPSGLVDVFGVFPVPIALLCGAAPEAAWSFASLWVLKVSQNSPGLA